MNIKELWTYASIMHQEIQYRAITIQRPASEITDPKVIKRLMSNLKMQKIMMSFFFVMFAIMTVFSGATITSTSYQESILILAFSEASYFIFVFFFILFFGLLNSSVYLQREIFIPFAVLPVNQNDLSKVSLLAFVRIFDVSIITAIFVYPTLLFIFTGSIIHTLLSFSFLLLVVMLALATNLYLAKIYSSKIVTPRKSRLKQIIRAILFIGWSTVIFGAYSMSGFMFEVIPYVIESFLNLPYLLQILVLAIYPFSFAYINVVVSFYPFALSDLFTSVSLIMTALYVYVSIYGFRWLYKVITFLPFEVAQIPSAESEYLTQYTYKPRSLVYGMLIKELKLTIRNPGTAMIITFPIIILLFYFVPFLIMNIEFVTLSSLIFTFANTYPFFAIAQFGVDGKATQYIFSYPVKYHLIVKTKAIFMVLMYSLYILTNAILILIMQPSLINEIWVLCISSLGIYSGSYVILAKLLRLYLEKGITMYETGKQVAFIVFVIAITIVYTGLPIAFIMTARMFFGELIAVAVMVIIELILLGTTYIAKRKWVYDRL
ncbi:MAG: hypothetical protein J7L47_02335 [Candidatus Odinarchaeota archaeon]|nr:hypothetical protein [Candidatus Odinarchaeota archaeon]